MVLQAEKRRLELRGSLGELRIQVRLLLFPGLRSILRSISYPRRVKAIELQFSEICEEELGGADFRNRFLAIGAKREVVEAGNQLVKHQN